MTLTFWKKTTPAHEHQWKAVKFAPLEGHGPFGAAITRAYGACDCGARSIAIVALEESDVRWLYRAQGDEPVPVPEAFLAAFDAGLPQ